MHLLDSFVSLSPVVTLGILTVSFIVGSFCGGMMMDELQWEDGIEDGYSTQYSSQIAVALYAYSAGLCNVVLSFWVVSHSTLRSGLAFSLVAFPTILFFGYLVAFLIGSDYEH